MSSETLLTLPGDETSMSITNLNSTDPMTDRARDVPEVRPGAGAEMRKCSAAEMNIGDTTEPVASPVDGNMKTGNMSVSVTGTMPGTGGRPQVGADAGYAASATMEHKLAGMNIERVTLPSEENMMKGSMSVTGKIPGMGGRPQMGADAGDAATVRMEHSLAGLRTEETVSTKTIARTDNETIGDTRTIARTGTKETGMGGRPQVGSDAGDAATVMAGLSTEETVSTRTIAGADTETIEGETLPGDEKFNDIAGVQGL